MSQDGRSTGARSVAQSVKQQSQPDSKPPSRAGTQGQGQQSPAPSQSKSRAGTQAQSGGQGQEASRVGTQNQQALSKPTSRAGSQTQSGGQDQAVSGTQMSNRSPVPPISRTPSADRRLLRALTVSPNGEDNADASPEPEYTRQTPRKSTPAQTREPTREPTRQSTREPTRQQTQNNPSTRGASPRQSSRRTATATPSYREDASRASGASQHSEAADPDVVSIRLPTPEKGEVRSVRKNTFYFSWFKKYMYCYIIYFIFLITLVIV